MLFAYARFMGVPELLLLFPTPLQKNGILKREGKDNDGKWVVLFNRL